MAYDQRIDGCLEPAIGASGLSEAAFRGWLDKLKPAIDSLKRQYDDRSLALLRVPESTQDLVLAEAALDRLCEGARTLVFFGTGGSSLGGQAVAQLGGWFIPGEEMGGQKRRPRTRFYDNLDPRTLEKTLSRLDLAQTRFVVISKSGNTPETLVQALAALQAVRDAGLEIAYSGVFSGDHGAGDCRIGQRLAGRLRRARNTDAGS